jgi:DNA-binding transcriptional regulator YdaS (Cro superfamily)
LQGEGKVSPETALKIEAATDGVVSRHHLRPDLFPVTGKAA